MNLYIAALVNPSFDGVYNATAPNPVRMTELCSALGSTLGRPSWIPVPAFALAVRPTPMAFPCFDVRSAVARVAHVTQFPGRAAKLGRELKHRAESCSKYS